MARLPLQSKEDLPDEYQDLFDVDEDDPDDVLLNVHRAMANNPRLLEAWGEWTWTLYEETGDARLRELVILAVANAVDSRYVWHQHVSNALAAGVSRAEITSIASGDLAAFDPAERAAIHYASALVGDGIDDDLHSELAAFVGESTVVAIVFLASEYLQVSAVIDAMAVELEDAFVGWQLERRD